MLQKYCQCLWGFRRDPGILQGRVWWPHASGGQRVLLDLSRWDLPCDFRSLPGLGDCHSPTWTSDRQTQLGPRQVWDCCLVSTFNASFFFGPCLTVWGALEGVAEARSTVPSCPVTGVPKPSHSVWLFLN